MPSRRSRPASAQPRVSRLALLLLLLPLLGAAPPQDVVGRSRVERVQVDVLVHGDDGFVADLLPADFRVFEDREPQEITGVERIDLAAGEVATLEGYVREEPEEALRRRGALALVVDAQYLDELSKHHVDEALFQKFVREDPWAGVAGVWMVEQGSGALHKLTPLTLEKREVARGTGSVERRPVEDLSVNKRLERHYGPLIDSLLDCDGHARCAQRFARDLAALADRDVREHRARAATTLRNLIELVDDLALRQGRTSVVWIGAGLQLTEGGPWGAVLEALGSGAFGGGMVLSTLSSSTSPDPELQELQHRLHEAANTANVSFYGVDPTRKASYRFDGPGVRFANRQVMRLLASPAVQTAIEAWRAPLLDAARATGGRTALNWSDLDRAIDAVLSDTARFYLLTYNPSTPREPGRWHDIRVEVDRDDVEVRARRGYREPAEIG